MSLKMKSIATVIFLGMLVGSVSGFGNNGNSDNSNYSNGDSIWNERKDCRAYDGQISKAISLCQSAGDNGQIKKSDAQAGLQACQNALSCNSLFSEEDVSDDDVAQAKAQAILDQQAGKVPAPIPTGKTWTIQNSDTSGTQSCSNLGLQQQLNLLTADHIDTEQKLLDSNKELKKLSVDIDKSAGDIQNNIAQTKVTIQNATFDQKDAESSIQAAIAKGDQNTVLAYQKIQEAIDNNKTEMVSLTSGAEFLNVQNQYKAALGAALAVCENNMRSMTLDPKTGLPTKNITIPGGGLNGLLSMAQCGGTTNQASSNPFSNNGCVTRNYCAANNGYIMAKSAAYNQYLQGLAALQQKAHDINHQNNTLLAQQSQLLSSNSTDRLKGTQDLTTRIARDQTAISNASAQLNSQIALAQNSQMAMQAPLAAASDIQQGLAKHLAAVDGQLAALKKANPNLTAHPEDAQKSQLAAMQTIQDGIDATSEKEDCTANNGSNGGSNKGSNTGSSGSAGFVPPGSQNSGQCDPTTTSCNKSGR